MELQQRSNIFRTNSKILNDHKIYNSRSFGAIISKIHRQLLEREKKNRQNRDQIWLNKHNCIAKPEHASVWIQFASRLNILASSLKDPPLKITSFSSCHYVWHFEVTLLRETWWQSDVLSHCHSYSIRSAWMVVRQTCAKSVSSGGGKSRSASGQGPDTNFNYVD